MIERPYHHGDLRAALLQAAVQLIREVGAEGLTLREVARRSGVSHTAPYRHFRDKDDLTAAIAEEGFVLLHDQIQKDVRKHRSARQRLLRAGRAYVAFALRRPEHFRVMFAADLDPQRHPAAHAAAGQAFGQLVTLVQECQKSDEIRGGDPVNLARIAWSLVHGIASLAIGRQFAFRTQKEVVRFAANAMEGLLEGL